jgi:hypothetical protein
LCRPGELLWEAPLASTIIVRERRAGHMRGIFLVTVAFLGMGGIGWADTVATYDMKDKGSLVISYRDDNHIRMDTGEDSYLLLTGGKTYGVSRDNGKWTAVDMEQVGRMGRSLGLNTAGEEDDSGEVTFQKTGRTETIAGYKGDVYIVVVTDKSGGEEQHEVVFGKHRDLDDLNRAWRAFGSNLGNALRMKNIQGLGYQARERQQELGTALRYEDEMILRSVAKQSLSPSHYELPRDVERVDMQDPPSRSTSQQDDVVTDTARKTQDAAKDEAQDSVVDEVRDQVRGVFRKMFD